MKYKENRFIRDILKIIQPVSLFPLETPAKQSSPSMWVRTTTKQQRELKLRELKLRELGEQQKKSLSKSKDPKRGGKKKRSRCCSTRRTKRHTRRRRRRH